MCSSLECDLFARRDLWFVFNVESQQQQQKCSSTEQHVILGGGREGRGGGGTPHFACIWSLFIYREPYCLNPYQAFYVWLFKLLWLIISRDAASPRLCRYSPPPIWNSPPPPRLSALYDDIFIFFLKRKDCVRFWVDVARTRGPIPASLRGVNDIYSVYFLHAVHINPRRCRYTTHIMFHSCIGFFFQGTTSITLSPLSHTELFPQERSNSFRVVVEF